MRVIDLMHLGRERVIGCWQIDDVIIDPGPSSTLDTLLAAIGETPPRAILLTHIHLDHAGAAGTLTERWPEVEVYVHERGVRHMADPSRLVHSARRLYGDDMDRLWGEMRPVPEDRLHSLVGGEKLFGDAFEVAYTPGHASHHVSYRYGDTAFVGDVGGVRVTPGSIVVPPTPPPDIDVEAWQRSIAVIRSWSPARLAMTHFGDSTDVTAQLDELEARLDAWSALAREGDRDRFIATVQAEILRDGRPGQAETYQQAAPVEQLYAGYERYWAKRA